jgi:hypothetical protein
LQLRKKHGKTSVRVKKTSVRVKNLSQVKKNLSHSTVYIMETPVFTARQKHRL